MEQDKITNTRDLQLFSLMQALATTGYQLMRTEKGGYVFYNPNRTRFGDSLMSMQSAIKVHNCMSHVDSGGADPYTVNQFLAAKVVHSVKLQYCKRTKKLIVNGGENAHLVAFTDEAYPELFNVIKPSE